MPAMLELLLPAVRARFDAAGLAVLAILACFYCRRYVQRRGAERDFSAGTFVTIGVLVIGGVLAAEWIDSLTRASGAVGSAVLARLTAIVASALLSAVVLLAAARLALLRAELRAHAETERLLQQAKTAADEASRAKSDFLAVMSHEIRTPLNAVMGFANLLTDTRLDAAQRDYVATITSEGARLGALINDILDLTKIEEGRLVLERAPFSPVDCAQEVLRLLGPRAAEKGIELRFETAISDPLAVDGDPLRIRQILLNLIDNAIKFTPHGSVTLFLRWNAPEQPGSIGRLVLRVHDTGIGIAEDKLKDLFQMFMQVDTSTTRRYGGTGLGLAICHRLVALMGGEITAKSRPNEGSEFACTLPLTAVSPPLPSSEAAAPAPAVPALRHVLVVDDMETNRFLLEVFLRRNGFIPELAGGGQEAIRLATRNRYDVILMDLQMPDIDGFTATQRIRAAEPVGRRTPIIALTATIAKGTRERCLAAGMDDYMTKPLDLKRFKALLNTHLTASLLAERAAGLREPAATAAC